MRRKSHFKGIELDDKGRSIPLIVSIDTSESDIDDKVPDDEDIELSRSEQWERLNELLLLITTILMFNATSMLIAIFQITWSKNGTAFNKRLILDSQETIGISVFSITN